MQLMPYTGKDITLEKLIRTEAREPYSEVDEPSVETLQSLFPILFNIQDELQKISIDDKLDAVTTVSTLWDKRDYKRRKNLQEVLPRTTGYHPNMIDFELSVLPQILDGKYLKESLDNPMCFSGGRKSLDGFVELAKDEYVIANPRGPIFIIGAGNATIPPLLALLTSLYTNNSTILRPSFANYAGLYEVMKSFEDVENDMNTNSSVKKILRKLMNATLILYMSHGSEAYAYFLRQAKLGVINFWGGEPALSGIKRMVAENPHNPQFVINGPLTGAAAIDGIFARKVGHAVVSKGLAFDTILYKQQMCNSPTESYYVGSFEDGNDFGKSLAMNIDESGKSFPLEFSEPQTIKTQHIRRSLKREGSKVYTPESGEANWTVVVSKNQSNIDKVTSPNFSFSIYERPVFLEIITVDSLDAVLQKIKELPNRACYRGIEKVQTVGYAMNPADAKDFARKLSNIGVYRTVPIGQMYYRTAFEPSDGEFLARKFTFMSYFSEKPTGLKVL